MKKTAKYLALTAILIAFSLSSVLAEKIAEAQLKTSAFCGSCKTKIEKSVNKLDGVMNSNLNLESKVLTVKYDSDKLKLDDIRAKIKKVGYEADLVDGSTNNNSVKKASKCCDTKSDSKTDAKCCDTKSDSKTDGKCCDSKK